MTAATTAKRAWHGVCEGAVEFSLRHPGALRPLVAGYNKVLFQKPRDATMTVLDQLMDASLIDDDGRDSYHVPALLRDTPQIRRG